MTISITPNTLPQATRYVSFSQTITANGDAGETITSVGIANTVALDPGITITNGVSSATISGTYSKGQFFGDDALYNLGVANQTPIELFDIASIPANVNLYYVTSTPSNVTINYNVIVGSSSGTQSFTVSQTLINGYESIRSFVANYYP